MATGVEVTSSASPGAEQRAQRLDIDGMVSKPSWKAILLELIESRRLDPWNIDIAEISDAFLKKVREMQELDLLVQANVILAAAILLKYKSEYLKFLQYQEQMSDYVEEGVAGVPIEDVPQLTLSSRIPPRRQITLDELVQEMESVIKYESDERLVRKPKGGIDQIVDLRLNDVDIEERMERTMARIRGSTDEEGWTLFSRLLEDQEDRFELIYALMSVLHLTQKEAILIRQDKLFGEIFIRLLDGNGKGGAKDGNGSAQEKDAGENS
jgi:segregation and condensation protein A